jgi:hypothetical protein
VSLPAGGEEMAYSRTSDKFYFQVSYGSFGEKCGLGVMDGSSDTLLGVIGIGDYGWDPFPCWCPDENRVYFFASKGARLLMGAVDCYTDSVVWEKDMYDLGRWFEYLDNGLMLCNHSDSLALVDPRTDSVLVDSSLAAGFANPVAHTGDGEKFYIVRPGRLEVRSSNSLSLLATIDWARGGGSSFLVYSDSTRKLFWFDAQDSVLTIDAGSDTVTARLASGYVSYRLVWLDRTGKYLFCQAYLDSASSLRVYNMQTDSLVGVYAPLPSPECVMANHDRGCVYVGCSDAILVFPDVPPGVEETPNARLRATKPGPTVVRGVLFLPKSTSSSASPSWLLDASGRRVLNLSPGANNIQTIPGGVYFACGRLRASNSELQTVQKVVIAK